MAADRVYWDSCVFLTFLQDEEGADTCELVLGAAEKGDVLIATSALTLAEVLNLRGRPKLPASREDDVRRLFSHEYILVRNITRRTAEFARGLVWNNDIAPKDALHVASAIEAKLPVLHTFDKELLGKAGSLDSVIRIAMHLARVGRG